MKRLAVLTSGGDAQGMNAAVRGVVRTALAMDAEIYGIERGYAGLLDEDITPMTSASVGGIVLRGGTMLRTARCQAFFERKNQIQAADILRKHGIDGLVVIGGDGSVQGAEVLTHLGIPTVTVPGTIDNDMHGTDETIGHDTAVNVVVSAVSRIRDSASAHERAAIVEVMGRFAGHIALDAGLACGAEYILVPEVPFERETLARSLEAQMKLGRTNSIIICAEGAGDARSLGGVAERAYKDRRLYDHARLHPARRSADGQRLPARLHPGRVRGDCAPPGRDRSAHRYAQRPRAHSFLRRGKKEKEPFRRDLYDLAVMLGATGME